VNKLVGWLGVLLGFFVAPFQLIKILQTGVTDGISMMTYIFLCLALICYLYEAIRIKSKVFITAQSINLAANIMILVLILK